MSAAQGRDIAPSLVRTAVPLLAGYAASWAARQGLDINDDNAALLIGMAVSYLYYVLARFAEVFLGDRWGYVLGVAKSPVYVEPPAVVIDAEGERAVDGGETSILLVVLVEVLLLILFGFLR